MSQRILVVDDDPELAEVLLIALAKYGFDATACTDGAAALSEFERYRPDLVLLDVMLPGLDGLEVCRRIVARSSVPIIMLTARTDTADKVAALDGGAIDYVVKPPDLTELVARIRAHLRPRVHDPAGPAHLRAADVDIDVAGHEVTRDGQRISLTPLEFDLLATLARKPGQVFTREMLLEQVWGYHHQADPHADTRVVNVHVQRLRAKVEHDPDEPRVVLTVRGVGYKAGPAS